MRFWAACSIALPSCACWIFAAVLGSHLLACVIYHVKVSWPGVVGGEGLTDCLLFTPSSLLAELEQLYLGLYGMSDGLTLAKKGSPLLTQKWYHSLRELDISGQGFSEKDLEQALAVFSGTSGGLRPALCSLNLRGTRVTPSTVRSVPLSLVL